MDSSVKMVRVRRHKLSWVWDDSELDGGDEFHEEDILLKRGMSGTDKKLRRIDRKSR